MMTMHRSLTALCAVALVAGCAPRMDPPPEFADYATNVQIARLLAGTCPSVALDQAAMGAGARDLGITLRDQGFTPEDIQAFPETLDIGTIQGRVQAYATQNSIDLRDSTTVCPAAMREINNGSGIGAFLSPA